MSTQLLEKLMTIGKELGYSGTELREWVTAQVKIESVKEEKMQEREERCLQREEQKNEVALRAQEAIRAREEAKAIEEAERQEKIRQEGEKIRREEMELKRLELEQQKELKLAEFPFGVSPGFVRQVDRLIRYDLDV